MAERRFSGDEMLRVPEERLNDYPHAPVRLLPGADAFFRYLTPYTFSSLIMGKPELVIGGLDPSSWSSLCSKSVNSRRYERFGR